MTLRNFILAGIWFIGAALTPVGANIGDDWYFNEPTDWHKQARLGKYYAMAGALAFWRKYRSELRLPPDLQAIIDQGGTVVVRPPSTPRTPESTT